MNNIIAVAKVKKNKIVYTYDYEGRTFKISTPKTALNEGVENGEIVSIMLGIMPIEGGKPSEQGIEMPIIDDE